MRIAKSSFPAQAVRSTRVLEALPDAVRFALVTGACLALFVTIGARAMAHDAPSGWSYPYTCCSNQDCRPVATKAVSEKASGYIINVTGEVVPYTDTRVRTSPDGEFHWCSVAGKENTRTICLFVPPRSF